MAHKGQVITHNSPPGHSVTALTELAGRPGSRVNGYHQYCLQSHTLPGWPSQPHNNVLLSPSLWPQSVRPQSGHSPEQGCCCCRNKVARLGLAGSVTVGLQIMASPITQPRPGLAHWASHHTGTRNSHQSHSHQVNGVWDNKNTPVCRLTVIVCPHTLSC